MRASRQIPVSYTHLDVYKRQAQLCRRDALLLLELMHGRELVPQARGGFELLSFGSGHHARSQRALQLRVAAFKKQLCIADGVLVGLGRGEAFNARAEACLLYTSVFVAVEVNDLLLLGDGGERLRSESQRFERLSRGVQLAQAAIDEHE